MNKYEEILGSVAAQRLRGSLTLVEIAVENRLVCLPPPHPPNRPLRVSRPTWDLNGELTLRESCSVGVGQNVLKTTPCVTPLLTHPEASTSKESLT